MKAQHVTILFLVLALLLVGCIDPTPDIPPPAPVGEVLCERKAFKVTQTESEVIVQNTWKDTVAIRISWNRCDPWGTCKDQRGNLCEDCYLNHSVPRKMSVSREFKDHNSVQVWAWGPSGDLIDECDAHLTR